MRKGYTVTYQMRKKQRQQREIVIQYVLKFVGVVLLAFLLVRFVCFSFTIQGDSMSPTIERGEKHLVKRLIYQIKGPSRYDVVIFKSDDKNGNYYVKRVIGLPGDIHFASPPYTSERAKLKVKALAQKITPYTGSSNLFVVPYTKPQEYIRDNAPDVLFTVLMRRSMMRIANRIATRQGCEALITGESLAQVASQTVKALQCTDAAQDLPILRPLIGMDKTEIIETSRHIGTYETSILPYEDCCTIFTPPHPKIRPELAEILEAEAAMPGLAELEAEAAENTERIRIRITDEIEFEG